MTEIISEINTELLRGRREAIFFESGREGRILVKEPSVGGRGHLVANVVHERKDPILPDQA